MAQKRKYNQWTEADMEHALKAYRENKIGLNECCRQFNIPKPTFKRHLNSKNRKANEHIQHIGRLTVFTSEIEEELTQYLLKLENLMFGVTIHDVRRLAFELAEKKGVAHNFNKEKGLAGKAWYYGFMKRHPNLSLRQPEKVSLSRVCGFNKENVYKFFDILEKLVDEHGFTAVTMFNVDESGFSTVQKKIKKSSRQKERNKLVVCLVENVGGAGQCVPPMIIFKRKRMANELMIGSLPGSIVTISDSGYINSELFVQWLQHFIKTIKPTIDNKVLLLLDGHTTHSKNLKALELAKENGVVILQLPGHTTHRLQPLDVSFFKPMESYFTQEVEKWLRNNPGKAISQYNMTALLCEAYSRAATINTFVNGFRAAGIWPVNRHVFSVGDFAPAEALLDDTIRRQESTPEPEQLPIDQETLPDENDASVLNILPLPQHREGLKKRKQSQSAVVLTSTPYTKELEEKIETRVTPRVSTVKRKLSKGRQKNFPKSKTQLHQRLV
ncbi:hypothetical protein PPYR_03868 [Photinus pyralis]|nr:hypothetical protein PPYR_03868 [Photinus pyralis]